MRFEELTPEQIEQAKKCETPEERAAFMEENGIELSDEQLENIAGGETGGGCSGLGGEETTTGSIPARRARTSFGGTSRPTGSTAARSAA